MDIAITPALKPHEAAIRLNVSKWTLRDWRSEGIGPEYVRIGRGRGVIRYTDEALCNYLAAHVR